MIEEKEQTHMPNLTTRIRRLRVQIRDAACKAIFLPSQFYRIFALSLASLFFFPAHQDREPHDVVLLLDRRDVPVEELLRGGEGPIGKIGEVGEGGGSAGGGLRVEGGEGWEVGLLGNGEGVVSWGICLGMGKGEAVGRGRCGRES